MDTKKISNKDILYSTTYTSTETGYLKHYLKIIFQDLESENIFVITHEADSILLEVLDHAQEKKTTNQLLNSIIKKSIHLSELIDNVDKLKKYVWNTTDFNKIKGKIRDIKINQIII